MANTLYTTAPWEELYGVALRKNVNLSEESDSSDSAAPSIMTDGSLSDEGKKLFSTTDSSIGIPGSDWKTTSEKYGVAVTNQPILEVGQEVNEYNKAIGSAVPTAGTGYSFQRGTQAPTTTFEFDVDRYTALPFLFGLFQDGATDPSAVTSGTSQEGYVYSFICPSASSGSASNPASSPNYFLSLFKTIDFPNGELITDALATSMTLTGGENEPLKASFTLLGHRYKSLNLNTMSGSSGGTDGIATDATTVGVKFTEMNPLHWNDAKIVIGRLTTDADGVYNTVADHIVVDASSFTLTVTANTTARRYNSRYAHKYVNNGYTVEGSVTIPYRSGTITSSLLKAILTDNAVSMTPFPIDILWYDSPASNIGDVGDSISTTDMGTLRNMDYFATSSAFSRSTGDFRITINAIPQTVPDTPDDEVMLTINFVGVDTRSGGSVDTHALEISWLEIGDGYDYLGARPTA